MGGENYLYSLLTGYEEPPADFEVPEAATTTPTSPATSSPCRRRSATTK